MYEKQAGMVSNQGRVGAVNNYRDMAACAQVTAPPVRADLPTGFRDLHAVEARQRAEQMREAIHVITIAAEQGLVETQVYGDAFVMDQLIQRGYSVHPQTPLSAGADRAPTTVSWGHV